MMTSLILEPGGHSLGVPGPLIQIKELDQIIRQGDIKTVCKNFINNCKSKLWIFLFFSCKSVSNVFSIMKSMPVLGFIIACEL